MKLSEAILLGSVGTGQAFNVLLDSQGNTCGVGAAMVGAGLTANWSSEKKMKEMFPLLAESFLDRLPVEWPAYAKPHPDLCNGWEAIVALNNKYRWTRPQIAEWVKQFEPQDDPVTVTETVSEAETETVRN